MKETKRQQPNQKPVISQADQQLILRRSLEARNHVQMLLERSDHKAGFVVTGIAFLGLFLQQGGFLDTRFGRLAFIFYGLSLLCVCVTAWPRKWNWYKKVRASDLYERHLEKTLQQEARASCRQEADLRAIYRVKNWFLAVGFACMLLGMAATQVAVQLQH